MPFDPNLWDTTQTRWTLPGVTDDEFAKFEKSHKIKLPALMKEMYRIQNGGMIRDESEFFFCPIGKSIEWMGAMNSLLNLVKQDEFMDADDLEYVEEEFGSSKKIIGFAMAYGHVMYALNYNDQNSAGEPSVISLANDGGGEDTEAETFAAWIGERFGTETELVLDWAEHENYPILFQSTVDWPSKQGLPAAKESVLCQDGKLGLRLYERTQQDGRTIEINRVTLTKGVDLEWLDVEEFGVTKLFSLHLQPSEDDDIQWVMCELRSNGEWKIERSQGVPIYAMLMSQDEDELEELAQALKQRGLAQESPPAEIPPEFQESVSGLRKLGDFLVQTMQRQLAGEADSADELPNEAPVLGGKPAELSRQKIVEELSAIVLYYAAMVRQVKSPADAWRMIADFEPYTRRYIEVMRARNPSASALEFMLELGPAEMQSRAALADLQRRNAEAHRILKDHEQSVVAEAVRPAGSHSQADELLHRCVISGGKLADALEHVIRDQAIEPHREALSAALNSYADCQEAVLDLVPEDVLSRGPLVMESSDMTAGWILMKWQKEPTHARLKKAWDHLRAKQRDLYQENRGLFQRLIDRFL